MQYSWTPFLDLHSFAIITLCFANNFYFADEKTEEARLINYLELVCGEKTSETL